jgi:hypothetical protein
MRVLHHLHDRPQEGHRVAGACFWCRFVQERSAQAEVSTQRRIVSRGVSAGARHRG